MLQNDYEDPPLSALRVTDDLYKNSVCVVVGKSVTTADLIKCERSGIDSNGQSQLSQGNLLVKGSKEVGSNRQEIQGFFLNLGVHRGRPRNKDSSERILFGQVRAALSG